jgi:hypothetical protein
MQQAPPRFQLSALVAVFELVALFMSFSIAGFAQGFENPVRRGWWIDPFSYRVMDGADYQVWVCPEHGTLFSVHSILRDRP